MYLDYAATTPVAPEVAHTMAKFLTADGVFGNPHSVTHRFGHAASEAIEEARGHVAQLIGADVDEILWTSGATEAINLAIKGVLLSPTVRGRHLLVSSLEHKAVLDTAHWLSGQGVDVTYLAPDADGMITPEIVCAGLRPDTALVSVIHVNNEVGTVTDIASVARVVRDNGTLLHVDAVQSAARLPIDISLMGVDLLSLSAHKIYGPKGVGALFVSRSVRPLLVPQIHGGGQEGGVRAGTLATHQVVGMGAAARFINDRQSSDAERVAVMDRRLHGWLDGIEGAVVNGNRMARVPGILNMAFPGVEAESLMLALGDVAISAGSACTAASIEPSHVLQGLGVPEMLALSSVRFSVGRYTTEAEVDFAGQRVNDAVSTLRSITR
ncbi:MAG: aminotransferase class V-fold PLP-dependent enzyme [Bryobacterales bacterium]|nr:aminotransferase class V-fold PLP-dependent enzyme [Bryobacterales bacterium]